MDQHSAPSTLDDVGVLRNDINKLLCSMERYNVDNLPVFEKYVKCQAAGNFYDFEANLAVLKLYQSFPQCYSQDIVYLILAKALTNLPRTDFDLCHCLLVGEQFQDSGIQRLCYLANLLGMCKFQKFWEEKFKDPGRLEELFGFDDSIRKFISQMVYVMFKNVKEKELKTALGCIDDQELQKCMRTYGWEKGSNEVVYLLKLEDPGKAEDVIDIKPDRTSSTSVEASNNMIPAYTPVNPTKFLFTATDVKSGCAACENKTASRGSNSVVDEGPTYDLTKKPSEESKFYWIQVNYKTPKSSSSPDSSSSSSNCSYDEVDDDDIVTGKWLIFEPLDKIDEAWEKISTAVANGILGYSAKVSTIADKEIRSSCQGQGVIYVYTYDHNNEYDVMRVRDALRRMGFTRKLAYKTDIATLNGEYSWNTKKRVSKYYI